MIDTLTFEVKMAHENEDGPTNIPGKGWRWAQSVGGQRKINAEREFWKGEFVNLDDVLEVSDWEVEGDIWKRKYVLATSNSYGDMFQGDMRVFFKADSAEVIGADGN